MRFNPKASGGGRVNDLGSSGGGGLGGLGSGGGGGLGGGRLPIPTGGKAGGGVGLVVLLVLGFVLVQCLAGGGDTGNNAQEPRPGTGTQNCTGEQANSDPDCARELVVHSLDGYWATTLPAQSDATFRTPSVNTFSGAARTACGNASSAMGPFYCPSDQGIYQDSTFYAEVLQRQLGGGAGDFVEPYVLAHEYGHHIQNLLGTMGRVRTQQGPKSDAVRLELQADCYAGMWIKGATGTTDDSGVAIFESIDEADVFEAMDAAKTVGDDRIQMKSGGRVNPESWTHGSAEQRQRWLRTGMESGTLRACDTFAANTL